MSAGVGTKAELRASLLAARRARSATDLAADRDGIRSAVLDRVRAAGWRQVACYVPLRTEPGSIELLAGLPSVIVPVLLADNDLGWRWWPDGPLLSPSAVAEVDAVLAPALAVDRTGTRLGRGGGSYDRALARVPAGVPVAALLFEPEYVSFQLPRKPWDVPVGAVVTPCGWRQVDGE